MLRWAVVSLMVFAFGCPTPQQPVSPGDGRRPLASAEPPLRPPQPALGNWRAYAHIIDRIPDLRARYEVEHIDYVRGRVFVRWFQRHAKPPRFGLDTLRLSDGVRLARWAAASQNASAYGKRWRDVSGFVAPWPLTSTVAVDRRRWHQLIYGAQPQARVEARYHNGARALYYVGAGGAAHWLNQTSSNPHSEVLSPDQKRVAWIAHSPRHQQFVLHAWTRRAGGRLFSDLGEMFPGDLTWLDDSHLAFVAGEFIGWAPGPTIRFVKHYRLCARILNVRNARVVDLRCTISPHTQKLLVTPDRNQLVVITQRAPALIDLEWIDRRSGKVKFVATEVAGSAAAHTNYIVQNDGTVYSDWRRQLTVFSPTKGRIASVDDSQAHALRLVGAKGNQVLAIRRDRHEQQVLAFDAAKLWAGAETRPLERSPVAAQAKRPACGANLTLRRDNAASYCVTANGERHGPSWSFAADGRVIERGTFRDGRRHGLWHFFSADGQTQAMIHFDQGRRHGQASGFSLNRNRYVVDYEHGLPHGRVTYWHPNSRQPQFQAEFIRGKQSGRFVEWRADGTLIRENTRVSGQLHGRERLFYENGTKRRETIWEHGQFLSRKLWDEKGRLIKRELPHGKIQRWEYEKRGDGVTEINMLDGKKHGNVFLRKPGKPTIKEVYDKGRLVGRYKKRGRRWLKMPSSK